MTFEESILICGVVGCVTAPVSFPLACLALAFLGAAWMAYLLLQLMWAVMCLAIELALFVASLFAELVINTIAVAALLLSTAVQWTIVEPLIALTQEVVLIVDYFANLCVSSGPDFNEQTNRQTSSFTDFSDFDSDRSQPSAPRADGFLYENTNHPPVVQAIPLSEYSDESYSRRQRFLGQSSASGAGYVMATEVMVIDDANFVSKL